MVENPQRPVCQSLGSFLDTVFNGFSAVEMVYRRESMKLWEGLVREIPSRATMQ